MVWTSNNPVGITFSQAIRSCGITDPTYNKMQQVKGTKRTPRCLKLHIKETSIKMLDIRGTNPVLAPPVL